MINTRLIWGIIVLSFVTYFIYFGINQVKTQHLKMITSETIQSEMFADLIETADVEKNELTVTINLRLADEYDELKTIHKFAILEFLNRQVRYYLLTQDFQNPYYNYDFEIVGHTSTNKYNYFNPLDQKQLTNTSDSTLKINGQYAYSKRNFHDNMNITIVLKNNEYEILQYAEKLFSLISLNGKYRNYNVDSKLILKSVEEKFGITHQEYLNIYKKFYLGFGYTSISKDASN